MGWEDNYDEEDYDPLDDLNDLEDYDEMIYELTRSLIHVDQDAISLQVCLILEKFFETFGYSLRLEIENKTFYRSLEQGYLAAHFTPAKYNRTEKYYTLYFNPNYKSYPDAYQYTLDYTDSFYDDEGEENNDADCDTINEANNIQAVVDTIVKHWKVEE